MMSAATDFAGFSLDDVWQLPFVGKGATREVYGLGTDFVVKVELGPDRGQNRAEVARWLAHSEDCETRAMMAPIICWAEDFSWLVMARVRPMGTTSAAEFRKFCNCASWQLGTTDLHCDNVGRDEAGRLVLLDYAN